MSAAVDAALERAQAKLVERAAAEVEKARRASLAMSAAMSGPLPRLTPEQADALYAIGRSLGRGWRARSPEQKKLRAALQRKLLIETLSPSEAVGAGPNVTGHTHFSRLSPLGRRYVEEAARGA